MKRSDRISRPRTAARGASGVVVGDAAQPAGKDTAAGGPASPAGYIATRLTDGKSERFKPGEVRVEPRLINVVAPAEGRGTYRVINR